MPDNLHKSIIFLKKIGIPVVLTTATTNSFIEGVWIQDEAMMINWRLADIAGIFHEAGHYAVTPSIFRKYIESDDIERLEQYYGDYLDKHPCVDKYGNENTVYRQIMQSGEAEAIAWSYAASLAAGIDATQLFETGFESDGMAIYHLLKAGKYLGINGLHHGGMCEQKDFPQMKQWLQV